MHYSSSLTITFPLYLVPYTFCYSPFKYSITALWELCPDDIVSKRVTQRREL